MTTILKAATCAACILILFGQFAKHADVLLAVTAAVAATVLTILPQVARLRAMARLRRHGQLADARVTSMRQIFFDEDLTVGVSVRPRGTTVTLTFADASGKQISGRYTRMSAPLAQEQTGSTISIVYDPRRPQRFSPVEGDYRTAEVRFYNWPIAGMLIVTAFLLVRAFA